MAKSKLTSSKSMNVIKAGGSGKMNTAPLPKGKGASVPNWNQSVSPANSFMKQPSNRTATGTKK